MPEALAALWSVLSAFLMLQRVEVLQKSVCVHRQAHTVVSIEFDYQCVTTTVDPRSS